MILYTGEITQIEANMIKSWVLCFTEEIERWQDPDFSLQYNIDEFEMQNLLKIEEKRSEFKIGCHQFYSKYIVV